MKRLFGFLILAAFSCMLHAQRVLSLDSCRNMAIANNKSLLIAKERMQKAHYDRKAAFTNFLAARPMCRSSMPSARRMLWGLA